MITGAFKKKIDVRIYGPDGTGLPVPLVGFDFAGFTKELNAGPSECVLTTDKAFDYAGGEIAVGNEVEINVVDKDTLNSTGDPRCVYRGYISLIERTAAGQTESLRITLLGYYTRLAFAVLMDGTVNTLYVHETDGLSTDDSSAGEISLAFRTAIDKYRAQTGDTRIFYEPEDVPDTGTIVHYAFQLQTYRSVLDKLKFLAPADWNYYVDETGRVKFGPKPSAPTHRFVFGRHVASVAVTTNMETVRNHVMVWNGEPAGALDVFNEYEDGDSILKYGRRTADLITDPSIDNSVVSPANTPAADLRGARYLAENKDPEVKIKCTILDNAGSDDGYDVESIQPGDTCSFYGFDDALADAFRDNMLITKVFYRLDGADIEVEVVKSGLLAEQARQQKQIKDVGLLLGLPADFS